MPTTLERFRSIAQPDESSGDALTRFRALREQFGPTPFPPPVQPAQPYSSVETRLPGEKYIRRAGPFAYDGLPVTSFFQKPQPEDEQRKSFELLSNYVQEEQLKDTLLRQSRDEYRAQSEKEDAAWRAHFPKLIDDLVSSERRRSSWPSDLSKMVPPRLWPEFYQRVRSSTKNLSPNQKKGFLRKLGESLSAGYIADLGGSLRRMIPGQGLSPEKTQFSTLLRGAMEQEDPFAPGKWYGVQRGALGAARMAPQMGAGMAITALNPAAGVAFWATQIYPNRKDQLISEGFDPELAESVALGSALVEGVIEQWEKYPGFRWATGGKQGFKNFVLDTAKSAGKEVLEEGAQAFAFDVLRQGYGRYTNAPGLGKFGSDNPLTNATREMLEAAVPVAMLSGAGGVVGVTKNMLTQDDGARWFLKFKPNAAKTLAEKETPTRRDMQKSGVGKGENWSEAERQKLAESLRTELQQQESDNAEEVRSDAGRVQEGGPVVEGGQEEGGPDLQRDAQAGPETGEQALPQEEVAELNQSGWVRRAIGYVKNVVTPDVLPEVVDTWHADRDEAFTEADIEAAKKESEVVALSGARNARSDQARELDGAIHLNIDLRNAEERGFGSPQEQFEKYGAKLTDEQVALYNRSQNLSPSEQEFADRIVAENVELGQKAKDSELLNQYYDAYTARLWKSTRKERRARQQGKFATQTPRTRQRSLESILHGWSEGKELQINGVVEAQKIARQQIAQVILDRQLIETAQKQGMMYPEGQQPDDWVKLKHPNMAKWVWSGKVTPAEGGEHEMTAQNYGRQARVSETGDLFEKRPLYAPAKLARRLNAALGTSALRDVPGFNALSKLNAIVKQTILFTSLFHHQAYLRSFMLAGHGLRPIEGYRRGRKAIENFTPELRELVRGGLTIGLTQDYEEALIREGTRIGAMIDAVPVAAEIKQWLTNLRDQQSAFLFKRMGPYLKVQTALLEYAHRLRKHERDILSGTMTREEIASAVASLTNDDFGGLHLGRMGRSPTLQHISRLLLLAPDWTESNVRMMAKVAAAGQQGRVARAMWARVFVRATATVVLFNLLMASLDDDDFIERYRKALKAGNLRWMDVDITPTYRMFGGDKDKRKYFSILGHFRDPIKFLVHPFRSARHKSSAIMRPFLEAIFGVDWKDQPYTDLRTLIKEGKTNEWGPAGSLEWDQAPSYLIKQAENMLPIQVQVAAQAIRGEVDAFDALTRGAGLMTASVEEQGAPRSRGWRRGRR
jgi:hypothetical protein